MTQVIMIQVKRAKVIITQMEKQVKLVRFQYWGLRKLRELSSG